MDDPRPPVGTRFPRVDAVAKVTGSARYAVDFSVPDMLHGKVVRSTRPHAALQRVDASRAMAVPGCVAVVTGSDVDEHLFPRFGHIIPDHPILAIDKVRYYGEPVALVLGETLAAVADAAELVDVDYDDLPAVMDPDAALEDDAVVLHESTYPAERRRPAEKAKGGVDPGQDIPGGPLVRGDVDGEREQRTNVAHEATQGWGDVETALADAHLVVESRVRYPMLYAYAMEPYNALAQFRDGALEVTSTAQHPFMVQRDLARVFDLPLSKVRVRVPFIGGGYGSKSYTKIEPLAAVGAWFTRRPVKVVLDVEEAIYTTRADAAHITVRSGFDADGTIPARDFHVILDTGAYVDNSALVLNKAINRCFGPYRIQHLRVKGQAVYTNTSPASSYRGFGAFQGNLAGETNIDQAAERLELTPDELRRRNLVRRGDVFISGLRPMDADLPADLDIVVERLQAHVGGRDDGLLRGIGFGCSASDAGAIPTSTAQVKVLADGSVLVLSGASEMGQGSRTVIAQIAAAELGVAPERLTVVQSDTAVTSFERTTGGSRTTTMVGLAVQHACADALDKLRAMAEDNAGAEIGELEIAGDGRFRLPSGEILSYKDIIAGWFGAGGGEVTGLGVLRRKGDLAQLPPFWEIGMVGVGLAIDPETGVATTGHLVTVADVGFAINPAGVEGQDLGAATQGLGGALYEELLYEGPQIVNANVVEYRVPRISDVPRRIDSVIAERRDGVGPYGAKGAGEGALNPIGSSVAAAVARAIGVWPDELPLTPERIWRLMQRKKGLITEGQAGATTGPDG